MAVKPIPEGYHNITPYLHVHDAKAAIDFYIKNFGAKERFRMPAPDGRIGHAELEFGDSLVMLSDEYPEMDTFGPKHFNGSPVVIMLYVSDVDSTFDRAIKAGAKSVRPVADQFYGDRSGTLDDPFGHRWYLSTHIEDVSPEEMEKRVAEMMKKQAVSAA